MGRVRREANTNALNRNIPTGILCNAVEELALVWWLGPDLLHRFRKRQVLGRNLKNGSGDSTLHSFDALEQAHLPTSI